MDWYNIDLNSPYERKQDILDSYDSETLLLEINCNLRIINKDTIREQFEESLNANVRTAREIFEANIDNILKRALIERNEPITI